MVSRLTQKERVLRMLQSHGSVCNSLFLDAHLYTFRNRIGELRRQGCVIETLPCDSPLHEHKDKQWRYVLSVGQMPLGEGVRT